MNITSCQPIIHENVIKQSVENENIFPVCAADYLKSNLNNYIATPPETITQTILEQLNSSKFSNFPLPEFPASLHHFL